MKKWGFLRETSEIAKKAGYDPDTGLKRTGLDEYLAVIFPNTNDWVHDTPIEGINSKRRPDYRSESLKLIVEFDGIPHYTMPSNIERDVENTKYYEDLGYKVVRIPYFIQLTNKAVKTLFNVDVKEELFDESIPSLGPKGRCSPAYLCGAGIVRMAKEFKQFPEQYAVNVNYLKSFNNEFDTGVSLLEDYFYTIENQNCERINHLSFNGLNKEWILADKNSDLIGDVLQKITFSISDLNKEISNYRFSQKSIIYQIVLSSWILEGVEKLPNLLRDDLIHKFKYENQEYKKAKEYLKAVRSFVVAHPLQTFKHELYGFDGDLVSTDIYSGITKTILFTKDERISVVRVSGIKNYNSAYDGNPDYYLKAYSKKKDNSSFFVLIGFYFQDLFDSINHVLEYVSALDKFLLGQKYKDYK